MSIDSNEFDSWLKAKLYRDIIFRSIIWFGISFATGYLAILYRGISPIEYFRGMGDTLMPLVNTIGTFSLLLCVLALMLKDLEATLGCSRRVDATRGRLGGFIRRLAGDLSLWTLGAFVTITAAIVLVVLKSTIYPNDYAIIGVLILVLLVFIVAIATANIFVRRNGPTGLVHTTKNSRTIAFIYLVSLTVLIVRLLLGTG